MTKKHFEAIASLVSERFKFIDALADRSRRKGVEAQAFDRGYSAGVESLALDMAEYFATQNERFDREAFYKACGL